MKNEMQEIVVVGAGFMGAGIAQVCIQNRKKCVLTDVDKGFLGEAVRTISESLEKLHRKGRIETDPAEAIALLETRASIDFPSSSSMVIEAVFEDIKLKRRVLEQIERKADRRTLIATNTSSIPIRQMAECLTDPSRFMGLHFFGPVPLMELVEVVKGPETSEETFLQGIEFIKSLGKYPVGVRKDVPGFVMNRVFSAAFRECQELVEKGIATVKEIDKGMQLGFGWRTGPFQIVDNAGLDTVMRIQRSFRDKNETYLYSESGMIEALVKKGQLGRKSGHGFYRYE